MAASTEREDNIMLIAPFAASPTERPPASRTIARPARAKASIGGILAWLSVGAGVLLLVPFARGDRLFGATLPFWLVAAPLIDLAWIERRRIARWLAESWLVAVRLRPSRNVRIQGAVRRAACSAARS
jgi:hypothetical protein